MLEPANRSANHRADEQHRREHSSRRAADKRQARRQYFCESKNRQNFPSVLAMKCLVDVRVSCSHRLRDSQADETDQQPRGRRLQIVRPFRQGAKLRTEILNDLCERERQNSADNSQHGIGKQFRGMREGIRWDAEHRLPAEKGSHDDGAGNRRKHDRPQCARAPRADHLLDHKQDRGNRRIERRRQARRRAHGREQPQLVPGKFQAPAERGSDPRSHLQGWIFRTKRLAAADRERTRQKFSDDGSEGHVPVENVDGGLGLVHAASAGGAKKFLDEKSDDQASSRRHQ